MFLAKSLERQNEYVVERVLRLVASAPDERERRRAPLHMLATVLEKLRHVRHFADHDTLQAVASQLAQPRDECSAHERFVAHNVSNALRPDVDATLRAQCLERVELLCDVMAEYANIPLDSLWEDTAFTARPDALPERIRQLRHERERLQQCLISVVGQHE